ncbi:MAG: DUF2530 domain-containing protein [Actinomycetes bacterium]
MSDQDPPRPARPLVPVEVDAVAAVTAVTVGWVVVAVVLLVLRARLAAHDASWWLAVPPTGVVLGLYGQRYVRRRRTALRRATDEDGRSPTG